MTPEAFQGALVSHPARYRIRVAGVLGPEWSEYLEGMTVNTVQDERYGSCSEITSVLADQAALMGLLQNLYSSVIPIVKVESLETDAGCNGAQDT